jgi:hypothetical protein
MTMGQCSYLLKNVPPLHCEAGAIAATQITTQSGTQWAIQTTAGHFAAAGIHAAAGAMSGGINAAITGGDIGLGAGIGAFSAGTGMLAGQYLPNNFPTQLGARSLIGGITGGVVSEASGGSFGEGFGQGALTAATGYMANCWLHEELLPSLKRTFSTEGMEHRLGQVRREADALSKSGVRFTDQVKMSQNILNGVVAAGDCGAWMALVVSTGQIHPALGITTGALTLPSLGACYLEFKHVLQPHDENTRP